MKMTQYLKWKDDPSKGEVFTPIGLVKEMLDKIPEEVWRNGWLDEVCSHMVDKRGTKWSNELIFQQAQGYKSKEDFKKNNNKAYQAAVKIKILDDIFPNN